MNTLLSPKSCEHNATYFPSITVLDENQNILDYLHREFGDKYRLDLQRDRSSFLAGLAEVKKKPDLILFDWDDQEISSEILLKLRSSWPEIPVVLMCVAEHHSYQMFSNLGVNDVVFKPFAKRHLRDILERVLPSFEEETATVPEIQLDHGHSFIRSSKQMRKIEVQAAMVARSDIPILILGESGTGKEILALFTHKMSLRGSRTFLKINCAAMPADLLESELFGYEQGAFTGATKMKPGKFELCDRGTVFLDEIGEMPAGLQAKLLQVLQDGTFSRLGGRTTIRTDVRIIAATNVDMKKAMAEKAFREDLYYRLNGISLKLPPLRERTEEIPVFANYFVRKAHKRYSLEPLPISNRLLTALKNYSWPGNLREMENVMNRFLVLRDETAIIADLIDHSSISPLGKKDEAMSANSASSGLKMMVRDLKGDAEKAVIASTLVQVRWNRKVAAGLLQISYKALLYKIKQYNLAPQSSLTHAA